MKHIITLLLGMLLIWVSIQMFPTRAGATHPEGYITIEWAADGSGVTVTKASTVDTCAKLMWPGAANSYSIQFGEPCGGYLQVFLSVGGDQNYAAEAGKRVYIQTSSGDTLAEAIIPVYIQPTSTPAPSSTPIPTPTPHTMIFPVIVK